MSCFLFLVVRMSLTCKFVSFLAQELLVQLFRKVVIQQGSTLSIVMNNDTNDVLSVHIFQRNEPEEMTGSNQMWLSDAHSRQVELDLYQALLVANFETPIWNRQPHSFTKITLSMLCLERSTTR